MKSKQTPFAPTIKLNVDAKCLFEYSTQCQINTLSFTIALNEQKHFSRKQMQRNSMKTVSAFSPSLCLRRLDSAIFKILLNYFRQKSYRAHETKYCKSKKVYSPFVWQREYSAYSFGVSWVRDAFVFKLLYLRVLASLRFQIESTTFFSTDFDQMRSIVIFERAKSSCQVHFVYKYVQ